MKPVHTVPTGFAPSVTYLAFFFKSTDFFPFNFAKNEDKENKITKLKKNDTAGSNRFRPVIHLSSVLL